MCGHVDGGGVSRYQVNAPGCTEVVRVLRVHFCGGFPMSSISGTGTTSSGKCEDAELLSRMPDVEWADSECKELGACVIDYCNSRVEVKYTISAVYGAQ